ncbi:MAG: hypothetical protein IJS50_03525 [Desulfovibrio sp.]|nr:hypothetical protein [Desulfovibrio sp.]
MIERLVNFFRKKSQPAAEIRAEEQIAQRKKELACLEEHLQELERLAKQLKYLKGTVQTIVAKSRFLLSNGCSKDNIDFLSKYLPYARRIAAEHVNYRVSSSNDLKLFWNLLQSKGILQRLACALAEKCDQLGQNKSDDFSAELAALDSILKMRGY